jgi:hypothetical protein
MVASASGRGDMGWLWTGQVPMTRRLAFGHPWDEERRFATSPPVFRELSLASASPLVIHIDGNWPYLFVATQAILTAVAVRKKYHEGSISKETARKLRRENDLTDMKAGVEKGNVLGQAIQTVRRMIGRRTANEDAPESPRLRAIEDKKLPPSAVDFADGQEDEDVQIDLGDEEGPRQG